MTPASDRVSAVITAFNPTPELVSNCDSLLSQVRQIVVVNDGSSSGEEVFSHLRQNGVVVIDSPYNKGIAAAINIGFKRLGALRGGPATKQIPPEFIITFDQDSTVPEGFIEALVSEYDRHIGSSFSIGIVAPEKFSGVTQTQPNTPLPFLTASHPIQSGIMMPSKVISALGPQREDYFIDSVDTEYYYRCVSQGYEAIAVSGLDLGHALGHTVSLKLFGLKAVGPFARITVSSPFRYYYRIRNRIFITKQYWHHKRLQKHILINNYKEFRHYFVALLATKNKLLLFKVLMAGFKAGIKGVGGKMPETLSNIAKEISWSHPAK